MNLALVFEICKYHNPVQSISYSYYIYSFSHTSIFYLLQVAELKRKLELEEMHKFRQMSRPKFSNISTNIVNDHDTTTTTLQQLHDKHKQKNNVFIPDDRKKNYNKNKKINEEDDRFLDYTSSSNEE